MTTSIGSALIADSSVGAAPSSVSFAPSTEAGVARTIDSVTFTGGTPDPTITVKGVGFGEQPKSWSADDTSCGTYVDNGRWWGNYGLFYIDNTNDWVGGTGKGDVGACVGIKLLSWTDTEVVFKFGSAYNSYLNWRIDRGDNFVIAVKKDFYGGIATFS